MNNDKNLLDLILAIILNAIQKITTYNNIKHIRTEKKKCKQQQTFRLKKKSRENPPLIQMKNFFHRKCVLYNV